MNAGNPEQGALDLQMKMWRALATAELAVILVVIGIVLGRASRPAAPAATREDRNYTLRLESLFTPRPPAPGPTPEIEPIGDHLAP